MKEETVIVKVEKKMKEGLKKQAQMNDREFSDYLRKLFQYAIDNKIKV